MINPDGKSAVLVRVGSQHWVVPSLMLGSFLSVSPGLVLGEAGRRLSQVCTRPMLHAEAASLIVNEQPVKVRKRRTKE